MWEIVWQAASVRHFGKSAIDHCSYLLWHLGRRALINGPDTLEKFTEHVVWTLMRPAGDSIPVWCSLPAEWDWPCVCEPAPRGMSSAGSEWQTPLPVSLKHRMEEHIINLNYWKDEHNLDLTHKGVTPEIGIRSLTRCPRQSESMHLTSIDASTNRTEKQFNANGGGGRGQFLEKVFWKAQKS